MAEVATAEYRLSQEPELKHFVQAVLEKNGVDANDAAVVDDVLVYVAGEVEEEKTNYNREHGVPVHVKVWDELQKLAGDYGIPFDLSR